MKYKKVKLSIESEDFSRTLEAKVPIGYDLPIVKARRDTLISGLRHLVWDWQRRYEDEMSWQILFGHCPRKVN
jgi:hypothetical protein